MTLIEALEILHLSETYTIENLMARFAEHVLSFSKEQLAEEASRNQFGLIQDAFKILAVQLGKKSTKEIEISNTETVGQYLNNLAKSRLDMNTHQIDIQGDCELNEVGTFYINLPVAAAHFSLAFDFKAFDLAHNFAGKSRYWEMSDKKEVKVSGVCDTVTREEMMLSRLQVDGIGDNRVRLIPAFLQYEFKNVTAKMMMDAFFSGDMRTLIPYVSSVTTHQVSVIPAQHYPALISLFARVRREESGAAEQLVKYVTINMKDVQAPAEPKVITQEITEADKNRMLRRMESLEARKEFGLFESILLDSARARSATTTTTTTAPGR